MDRTEILQRINWLADTACGTCPERASLAEGVERGRRDRYCLHGCPVGKELRQLGVQLDAEITKRRMGK